MSLRRARSAEEYGDWVSQAMHEVGDLKACLQYELDESQPFPAFVEPLEAGIRQVYQAMVDGSYSFGRDDLAFMDILRRNEREVPFYSLLVQINETHRKGLDVPD